MREKLIELLRNTFEEQHDKRRIITAPHTAAYLIANGVTIDPESLRPKGEWIEVKGRIACSRCGNYPLYDWFGKIKLSDTCPSCGADMRPEEAT